jgi:hypothetical protein
MTAYKSDMLLSAAALDFRLEPCEAPNQAQAWNDEPLKEGDIIEKFTVDGPAWFCLTRVGRRPTGRATPNYHPQSGGDWKLGHRD